MTSKALANALMIIYCFPLMLLACSLKYLDNSNSIAPAPTTIFYAFKALLTIIIASFNDLSASAMNYSAPPLKIIVAVLVVGHPLNKLYLSAPIYFSSNSPQKPRFSTVRP